MFYFPASPQPAIAELEEEMGCVLFIRGKRSVSLTREDSALYQDETVDLVVVGSGIAGLCATMEAHEQGLNVTLVEQMGPVGADPPASPASWWEQIRRPRRKKG